MKRLTLVVFAAFLLPSLQAEVLWSIGKKNDTSADLALGADRPDREYNNRFPQNPLFIIGLSDPARDWPAIQPGPADTWAHGTDHTFKIAFGLQATVSGTCRLVLDLVEAHSSSPPQLVVAVNNHSLPVQRPAPGNGDATTENHPEQGRHQTLIFEFPGEDLRPDYNLVTIQTEDGSWILYDALHLETPDGTTLADPKGIFLQTVTSDNTLSGTDDALRQTIHVPIYWMGQQSPNSTLPATLTVGKTTQQAVLKPGFQTIDFLLPAVQQPTSLTVSLNAGGQTSNSNSVELRPMRKWVIYVLSHSHHDLGYTDIQPHIQEKQMHNFDLALNEIAKSKDYPDAAHFVWNAEVSWSLDDYFNHFPANQSKIIEAIKAGSIYPNGWYANELTGLCRPEELLRLSTFDEQLVQKTGVPIDSAMISDVPGTSWGCIQALNEAGIRYLSNGPNPNDRIGHTMVDTEDKPFYWVSPSGNNKVLFWTSYGGYALAPGIGLLEKPENQRKVLSHLQKMEDDHYPYDILYIRWDGFGDNANPDDRMAPFVKDWNATHAYPHFVFATTSTAMHALENKYGPQIPVLKGEFTPYWEDGSGSSAHETSLNREAAEQLVQAETLYALLKQNVPAPAFYQAWRKVIMYDEHTWGAWDSVGNPTRPGVLEQWKFKQAFAVEANQESYNLLNNSVSDRGAVVPNQFDVYNTCNWPRTDVIRLGKDVSSIGDAVMDARGHQVPSQRLSTGELAFLAQNVPPWAAKRYIVTGGHAPLQTGTIHVDQTGLSNSLLAIKIDPKSGGITEWTTNDHVDNLIDNRKANLNDYVYALGGGLEHLKYPEPPQITVEDAGPLVASILVQSTAPGTNSLKREIKIYNGISRVDLIDTLDKTDVLDIEAGHVAFPFNLPDGQVRLDSQFAVTRPEIDQIPGANKNWFTVSRWADVSNTQYGVTLATVDAPLVEVGGITATLVRGQGDPNVWRKKVDPTQTLYSWIFNNHWETNYKASQSGILTYRYSLLPHAAYDALSASRFGVETSQPLQVFPVSADLLSTSRMTLAPNNLLVTAFKRSDDGQAFIVRFFNPSDAPATTLMNWSSPQPNGFWQSDMSEKPLKKIDGVITVPAWSLLTVRVSL